MGGNDGGDDAAGRGSGCLAKRSCPRCAHSAAVRRVVPCRLDARGRRGVCVVPSARIFCSRRACNRCRGYELTPLKQHFRRRCGGSVGSGFEFGLCCVGSSIGLMLMLVARSVMSVNWMAGIAALVLAQKLLPAKATIDVPLGLAIVGLGLLIVVAPSSVPGLTPPMAAVIGGADLANLL
ncbi:MAG: DUF2182 domain-containing protein [Chloroflexi bacterium]|nr:MAG: DUF2182 domain-containing protein [Chloroflexota bacterium]